MVKASLSKHCGSLIDVLGRKICLPNTRRKRQELIRMGKTNENKKAGQVCTDEENINQV